MASEPRPLSGGGDPYERSSILGDPRQRRILSILLDRSRPTTVDELGARLAARESETEPSAVSEADEESIRIDLQHRCLPKLIAVGWVERRPEGVVADEPIRLDSAALSLPDLREPDHPSWDGISAVLARPYRQDIVSILADEHRPVAVTELATELLERDRAPAEARSDVSHTLHHVDLPKLADVGLIEYDPGDAAVERTPRLSSFVERTELDTERR